MKYIKYWIVLDTATGLEHWQNASYPLILSKTMKVIGSCNVAQTDREPAHSGDTP